MANALSVPIAATAFATISETSWIVPFAWSAAAAAADQRGFGFDRVVNGTQDIGAYERQIDDDEIFYGGFD